MGAVRRQCRRGLQSIVFRGNIGAEQEANGAAKTVQGGALCKRPEPRQGIRINLRIVIVRRICNAAQICHLNFVLRSGA